MGSGNCGKLASLSNLVPSGAKRIRSRRPVHDTGVDALAKAGFGVPNRAGGGDQFASCAGSGGGKPYDLREGSGVDEGDQGLVVAG
jgi:hypothetical protein